MSSLSPDFESYLTDTGMKVVFPGKEPKFLRVIFQEMPGPNQREVLVRSEKERLLSIEGIQFPPPDELQMVIEYIDDSGQTATIRMDDNALVLSYRKYLCRGDSHIEFTHVQSM